MDDNRKPKGQSPSEKADWDFRKYLNGEYTYAGFNEEEPSPNAFGEKDVAPGTGLSSAEKELQSYGQWGRNWDWGDYGAQGLYTSYTYVRTPRTSDTHPLKLDIYASRDVWTPGFLGMTIAPGKKQKGGMTADWDRDLQKDLSRLRNEYGVDSLVSLVEEHELVSLQIPNLLDEAFKNDIDVFWFPIPDMQAPKSVKKTVSVINYIVNELKSGRNVVVHCKGGLGRTGCITACALVALGWDPGGAIAATRVTRMGTVQTDVQEKFVYKYWWETAR